MQSPALRGAELAALRSRFPITATHAYMNHAGMCAPPRESARAAADLAHLFSATADLCWLERNRRFEEVRALAARLMGAGRPEEVAFLGNTSDALSVVAAGLDWRSGDNIVGAEGEYPSNVYPWLALGRQGVEYRTVPERGGRFDPDELVDRMDGRTRVLALSWVQFATGDRADLAALGAECRRRDVLFVVDAIQGLGVLRLDVEAAGIDVAASGTHKWLLGPEGLGLLYVSDRVVERIRPLRAGWRSVADMFDWGKIELTWNDGAKRHEPGTLPALPIVALGASLELLFEVGPERIEERALALSRRAARGLAERGFELTRGGHEVDAPAAERSAIVTAVHPGMDARKIEAGLKERGIVAAARVGRFRVSPHFYNTEEEVDRLLDGLDEILP